MAIKVDPFIQAIRKKAVGAEVLRADDNGGQLRLVFRIPKGPSTTAWLEIVRNANNYVAKTTGFGLDISKQYFNASTNDLRYQWRLILQGGELEQHMTNLIDIIDGIRIRARELEEVPLVGSPNRSKTAGLMGHVSVGVPPRVG